MSIKDIFGFINLKTLTLAILSVCSTYLSTKLGLLGDFPLNLIGIAIVFPIVFSIAEAYKRREVALEQYAIIKALSRTLFFSSRDWSGNTAHTEALAGRLTALMRAMRIFFRGQRGEGKEREIYKIFSHLSRAIETMKNFDVSASEISRINRCLSQMLVAFERMKHIHQYRTPITLRLYSKIFIFLLPILYGPYFAFIAQDFFRGLTYVIPIFLTVVLVSLDNIQEQLENPFDNVGSDDVFINAEKFQDTLSDD